MKRLADASVALLFVMTIYFTYKKLTREPPPVPAPGAETAAPAVAEVAPIPPQPALEPRREQEAEIQPPAWNEAAPPREEPWSTSTTTTATSLGEQLGFPQPPSSSEPAFPGSREAATSSRPSDIDLKRNEARQKLAQVFQSLGPNGRNLIQSIDRHVKSCGNVVEGLCRQSLENIGRQAIVVGKQLDYAQELARTSWIPPGEVRDLREKYGIDDSFFDQVVRAVNRYTR